MQACIKGQELSNYRESNPIPRLLEVQILILYKYNSVKYNRKGRVLEDRKNVDCLQSYAQVL